MSRHGFLLIADITGYTRFLTGSELEHAQGVLEDLFAVILERLKSPLTLSNIQGDAFFAYADDDATWSPGQVVDAIEALYFGFRDRLTSIVDNTTCPCRACSNAGKLDLKFVVHHGEYVVQEVAGRRELAGPDVVLLHRLLKNDVPERTGIASYALLTAAAVAALDLREVAESGEPYTAELEEFGRVEGVALDLGMRWQAYRAGNEIVVDDADLWMEPLARVFPAGVEDVWEAWFSPALQMRWNSTLTRRTRIEGDPKRLRIGATDHCAHGDGEELLMRYIDVRALRYATIDVAMPMGGAARYTVLFAPEGDDTRLTVKLARAVGPGAVATWLLRLLSDLLHKKRVRAQILTEFDLLERFLTTEARRSGLAAGGGLPLSVDQIRRAARQLAAE